MATREDYARVARAIEYLKVNQAEQPELAEVAQAVGLSEYHFQRLFRRWAGISPKRFLQYLTLRRAKELLAEPKSLLDASFAAGLSGPSRLHDLFVAADGVTPGEYRSGGAGAEIRHGVADSPFGPCLVGQTERGICWLQFVDTAKAEALAAVERAWPQAQFRADPLGTKTTVERIFAPGNERRSSDMLLHLRGTNFQLKVWQALLRVPSGQLVTYADVARSIGRPEAVRAVGAAIGRNDVAVLIPCHRVIRSDGNFGEYKWGPTRKLAIIGRERALRELQLEGSAS